MPIPVTLDPADPLEAGSAILAAIAWPDALPEGEKHASAQAALVAHVMRLAAEADPDWPWTRQSIKPGYLLMDPKQVRKSIRLTFDRINAALKAARVARLFIGQVLGEQLNTAPPPLPPGVARASLNEVTSYVLGDEVETDPHNFEQRVFRRSLPVLHLAVALEQALMTAEAATEKQVRPEALLTTAEFLPWFVARAIKLEPTVLAIRAFRVPPKRLVQVRLAG